MPSARIRLDANKNVVKEFYELCYFLFGKEINIIKEQESW